MKKQINLLIYRAPMKYTDFPIELFPGCLPCSIPSTAFNERGLFGEGLIDSLAGPLSKSSQIVVTNNLIDPRKRTMVKSKSSLLGANVRLHLFGPSILPAYGTFPIKGRGWESDSKNRRFYDSRIGTHGYSDDYLAYTSVFDEEIKSWPWWLRFVHSFRKPSLVDV